MLKTISVTRRVTVLFALLAILSVPSLAVSSTVVLTDYTTVPFATNAPHGGGAFLATTSGQTGSDPVLGTFITFCIEFTQHFSYGTLYNYVLSDSADGAVGGPSDPVDDATKWLYYEVRTGGYSSIAEFGSPADIVGVRIQEAIWYIEQERLASDIGAASLALAQYAVAHQNWSQLFSEGNRVYAMNLTDAAGRHQDQLAFLPGGREISSVPEPASLLLLGT